MTPGSLAPAPSPVSSAPTPEPCSCRWWLESADYWFEQAETVLRSTAYWRELGDVDTVLRLTADADRCAEHAAVCTQMAFIAVAGHHVKPIRRAA